jgi:hypothetical protein
MAEQRMKPIWYFVGLMLLMMGSLIALGGVYDLINPPAVKTVLGETHPNLWWGAVMALFGGGLYWRSRKESA